MRILAISLALVLASCATTKTNYTPITEQLSFPKLNTVTSVPVGAEMLKQGTSTLTKGILLPTENNIHNYTFSAGFYPQIGEDEEFTYHSYQMGRGLAGYGGLTITGGILGPMQNNAVSLRATKGSNQLCVDVTFGSKLCDNEHSYERVTRPVINETDFQQTLLYNGRIGNKIRLGYREFSGGLARSSFSNEVEYDLDTSNTLTYKGAKIEVLSANNDKISYRVLTNFNTP